MYTRQFIDLVANFIFSFSPSIYLTIRVTGTTSSLHDKYTATTTPRDGMSRTASGSDINERTYSMFFPIERLAKVRFSDYFLLSTNKKWNNQNKFYAIASLNSTDFSILFKTQKALMKIFSKPYRFCIRKHNRNAASMALFRRYLWFVCRLFFCYFIYIHTKKHVVGVTRILMSCFFLGWDCWLFSCFLILFYFSIFFSFYIHPMSDDMFGIHYTTSFRNGFFFIIHRSMYFHSIQIWEVEFLRKCIK